MIDIAKKLETAEYGFLKSNPDLENVIYLVLSGSHGYGTNNENSDIDMRGVLVEQPQYFYGLNSFEQFEDLPTDTVIYGLKKYIKLLIDANPNALELLGVDESSIVKTTGAGQMLRDNADLFLSKRVINSFGNYATAQLRRLQNALCHDSLEEQEKTKHLQNTLNAQLAHFRKTYTNFEEGAIEIYTSQETGKLHFNIDLKDYPVNEFVGIYSEISNIVRTYNRLNHRNNKKDEAHLYKHAMHLIRLLITGTDILAGKGIITKRTKEHELLMDLRNGNYRFDEIFKLTDEYQAAFEKAAAETRLEQKPYLEKVERLMIEAYGMYRL